MKQTETNGFVPFSQESFNRSELISPVVSGCWFKSRIDRGEPISSDRSSPVRG